MTLRKTPITYMVLKWNSDNDWFDISYETGFNKDEIVDRVNIQKSHIFDLTKTLKMFEYMKRDQENQFYGSIKENPNDWRGNKLHTDVLGWVDKYDSKWYQYRSLNKINDDIRKYKDIYKNDKCKRVLFKEV
mgnify:FL=1